MNHNPWYVNNTASYERQRTQDEMREIRLQQKAMKAANRSRAASPSQMAGVSAFSRTTLLVARALLTILLG
jgi:hypothetical protein